MKHKLLQGKQFIDALIASGLLPETTVSLLIRASLDQPVEIMYECLADDRLLPVTDSIEETDDPGQAVAR